MRVEATDTPSVADESAHSSSAIEWWFVQGHYESQRAGRRHFMLGLFRHAVGRGRAAPENGFSLLVSILDPATGRKENLTQFDPAMVQHLLRMARETQGVGLAHQMVTAWAREVEAYGLPRPHRREDARAELGSTPFSATWKGVSLRQLEGEFELSFVEPESARSCTFRLRPIRPRLLIRDIRVPGSWTMDHVMYPHLALSGDAAGERVEGEAWLGHQWGGLDWFLPLTAEKRVLGWDGFAVNLDDGPDLLIMLHRDMSDGTVVHSYAAGLCPGKGTVLCHGIEATPSRFWESPATHIRYPVAWDIRVPELELALRIEPLVDDQEVQILGVIRATWEGAGTAAGSLGGRPVAGRARMELHGYGCVLDYREYLDRWADRIDRRIEEFLPKLLDAAQIERYAGPAHWQREPAVHTATLSEPLWDLMQRRGKHWRPLFGILLLQALGVPPEPHEMLISVTAELLHTGALIVDDIQDNSNVRRGEPSIHLRYGTDVAINAANAAYFLAYVAVRDHPHFTEKQRLEGYSILVRQSVRAHVGQGQDIYWSKHMSVESMTRWMHDSLAPKILQAYADKTAALVEGTAEAACVLANADAATRAACVDFARSFGVAFQITDDVLDYTDDREQIGADLTEGKLTYVVIRALESLAPPERGRLLDILCASARPTGPEALSEGIELVRRSGALVTCRREALAMVDDAWGRLSAVLPPSEPKIMLRALCSALLHLGNDQCESAAYGRS